jgi:predicted nucleic acid-binding protein
MKHYVFDSYALIAFFRKERSWELIQELLIKMSNNEITGWITTVNIGEIYYMISRKNSAKQADLAIKALLNFPLNIIEADLQLALQAAKLKAAFRLSYADAFAAALTISKKAVLLTGDQEFLNLKDEKDFEVQFIA